MEIKPDDVCPEEHSKFEKQVQQVSIGQTEVDFDTLTVNITNADSMTFKLRYQVPGTSEYFVSETIEAGGDAN